MSTTATHEKWMRAALAEAEAAEKHGDVPIGAVVVLDDVLVATGRNERVLRGDPLAHAEVVALQAASRTLSNWRLDNVTLYVTLEPCPMCAGALVQARVRRLVYGAQDHKLGAVRSMYQLADDPRSYHQLEVVQGILQDDCQRQLTEFFRARRIKPNRPAEP